MDLLITVVPLLLRMLAAYRGISVIIVAPFAALLAVLLFDRSRLRHMVVTVELTGWALWR